MSSTRGGGVFTAPPANPHLAVRQDGRVVPVHELLHQGPHGVVHTRVVRVLGDDLVKGEALAAPGRLDLVRLWVDGEGMARPSRHFAVVQPDQRTHARAHARVHGRTPSSPHGHGCIAHARDVCVGYKAQAMSWEARGQCPVPTIVGGSRRAGQWQFEKTRVAHHQRTPTTRPVDPRRSDPRALCL
jgi:hypothetical protein